jgi:hypothetical protein
MSGDKRRKPIARDGDLTERQRQQRRQLERASRAGQEAGERGKGAARPESSRLDNVMHGVELGAQAAHLAGEAAELSGVAIGGAMVHVALAGREVVKAIGETHDAHQREAGALGTRHALSVMMADCNNPQSPHIRDGTPYNKAEFSRRVEGVLGSDKNRWMTTLQIENSQASQPYDRARDGVVDAANGVLSQARTAAERQQMLATFTNAAAEAMAAQRRQWSTAAGGQGP